MTNLNPENIREGTNHPSKSSNFIEKSKRAVRNTLVKTGIAASTMAPMATTTTSTIIPASINTITTIAPTASTTISTISLGTATTLLAACSGGSEDGPDIPEKDTTPPTINVSLSNVDMTGGKEIKINGNQLYIGDNLVASWTDNVSKNCSVTLTINGQTVSSGTTIDDEGTLNIKVSDAAGNTKTVDIKLESNSPISGLENLNKLNMQVDQETNLLNGITIKNGAELIKTEIEIDGEKKEISDPYHYTPAYPGTCKIIITLKDKNGQIVEYKVDNLTIKALDYTEATINIADIINEKYSRYNNLQPSTKDFIYPHLLASYAACNWSKQDNRVHIIMGETADNIENIGSYPVGGGDHAYEGYYRMRAISPDVDIKGCQDERDQLEKYINQHPDKIFFVSCAADTGGGNSRENLMKNGNTQATKNIIKKENVIVIVANGNRVQSSGRWKVFCENIKDGNRYDSASINSKLNNKITVVGYNSRGENNYFAPIDQGGLDSAMPVGYEKDKGNIVMPMIPLISSDNNNKEATSTASSFPTAVTSGVIGNATSVIMANHPGITLEDAMTIICNKYLREETFQYKDETTNYELTDGGKRYFLEMQKLLDNELLQSNEIEKIQFNSDNIQLPSGKGICYTGVGIQFEFEGKKYDTTKANQDILNKALKSGNIKWYWNKESYKKHGGKDSTKFNVYVVDKEGKRIPDLYLNITKSIC